MREPIFLLGLAMLFTTVVVVARAIAGAIAGRGSSAEIARLREELDQLAAELDEARTGIAGQGTQIAELQERLDFAERVLAQHRERAALGPGGKQA